MSYALRIRVVALGGLVALAALSGVVLGQPAQIKAKSFDRSVVPAARKTPELHVPSWTKIKLANGAQLIVSERHNLPLVSVTVSFLGGANQLEAPTMTGVAQLVAGMLAEGTTSKSGNEISAAMQILGTSIRTSINGEDGNIGFSAMKDKLEPSLALLVDLVVNPVFPAEALERRRASTLVALEQSKDVTSDIADVVFPKVVYSTDHPYGRSATEESIKSITRDDVVAFHRQFFQPSRAIITVVGDVKADDVRRMVERVAAPWSGGGARGVAFTFEVHYPAPPAPKSTTIYLVDKPEAAQSSFSIGGVGPARNTPDYFALRVMNALFGELFQSRLNANIREQKGYSYGVFSSFAFGRGPGAYRASGDIVTAKTDSALVEFMKEIRGIRGERALTDDEMEQAKNSLVQRLPSRFSSVSASV